MEVCVEFWGDFACFSPPYEKVERLSYPFPTPSAARGMLSAIYSKPKEFYWQITRIEVLSPISYISFKRNEIKDTVSDKPVNTDDSRTQRLTTALKDVRYRITAAICPRPEFAGSAEQLYQQALLNRECVTLRQLAVGGRELMDLGMKPGRELGSMLSELLEYVIDDPERNKKEILCAYVKEKTGR